MSKLKSVFSIAILSCAALNICRAETTTIRDTPGGKRLLFVDGENIRPEPGGDRLLFIDGQNIRPEPGEKRFLFVDGDNVRPDPTGIRLLFIDGQDIRRTPGGKRLLFIDGKDIRPEPGGKRLYFIDGPALSKAQLVAVLYKLNPGLFKLSAEEEAALKKAMADAAAEEEANARKDPLIGNYSILTFSSTDERKAGGNVTIEKKGDFYKIAFKNTKMNESWEGVGFKYVISGDTEMWAVMGAENTTALAVYEADEKGVLNGRWAPCYLLEDPASFGTEQLTPAGDNKYTITAGKAPKTGAPYAGTCEFKMFDRDLNGDGKAFEATWTMGEVKVTGIGCRYKSHVAIAASTGPLYHIVRFKVENASTGGDLRSNTGATGFYTIMKD